METEVAGDACTKEGEALANFIIADSKGKANAMFVGTKTFTCNVQRQESFLAAMKACDDLQDRHARVRDRRDPERPAAAAPVGDPDQARLTYIVGTFDAVALAASDAIRQAGKRTRSRSPASTPTRRTSSWSRRATSRWPTSRREAREPGWAAADAAARAIAGHDLPPTVSTSQLLITKDNIDQLGGKTYVGATGFEDQFKKLWDMG